MERQVAIVTGGSSGIGKSTAAALIREGYKVYCFSRRGTGPENALCRKVDVRDEAAVNEAVCGISRDEGHIDLLVNAAGYGIAGAIEFTGPDELKDQFDVNFFGLHYVTRAVLPVMRTQGSGRIISISSMAGPVAIPFQAFYSASKAALNCYTAALANEVRQFGISVCAVQLGDISTGFTGARNKNLSGDDIYNGVISRSVSTMESDERNGMSPDLVGAFIVKTARKSSVKPLYTVGAKYRLFSVLCNIFPCRLRNYIVGKMYSN